MLAEVSGRELLVSCRMFDVPAYRRAYLAMRRLVRLAARSTSDARFTIRSHGRFPEVMKIQDRVCECDRGFERRFGFHRKRLRRVMHGDAMTGFIVIRGVAELLDASSEEHVRLDDRPALIAGFMQSDLVVNPQIESLRSEIKLPVGTPYLRRSLEGTAVSNHELVAVHVRRGDYTKKKNAASFALLPPEWYREAAEIVIAEQRAVRFIVVSDDPAWCRDHLRLPGETRIASAAHPISPLEDLALIASCRHQIIANSTFSWWGARLSPSMGTVVAPSSWFRDRETPSNLFPDSWKRLQNPVA